MRLEEISFKPTDQVLAMSDTERHEWLTFIHDWLAGNYMRSTDASLLGKWRQLAQMFPPRVPKKLNLFRLVTVPISYAKKSQFTFKPAPGKVSSWTRTLTGLDAVAGIAFEHNGGIGSDGEAKTARIGIEATISGGLVLATPTSIRNAFMILSHDYADRYIETPYDYKKNGQKYSAVKFPGYPGGEIEHEVQGMGMSDVYSLQDVLNRPGGHLHQYEYIIQTPPKVDATVVQHYRIGTEDIRRGNDDPNQFSGRWPRITRMKHPK